MKLTIDHLTKKYNDKVVLDDITLALPNQQIIAFLGASGSGKSTLLRLIAGLEPFHGGNIQVNDIPLLYDSDDIVTFRKKIGFVFQAFNLIDELSVYDNIALPLRYREEVMGDADIKQRVMSSLDKVQMSHRTGHKPNQLSGGQQQRIAIARALVGKPDLILVDEPTGNLDSKNGDQVIALLEQLNKDGSTIVMVTHDSRYSRCANREIQLLDGQIVIEQQLKVVA